MPVQSLNENIAQSVKKKKRQPVYTKELHQLKIIETIKDWVDEITEGIESLSTTKSKKATQPIMPGIEVEQIKLTPSFHKLYKMKKQWQQKTKSTVPDFMKTPDTEYVLPKEIDSLDNILKIKITRPEPFANKNIWKWLANIRNRNEIELEVTTNGSIDPTAYKDIINSFAKIKFTIRIDGHGELNDYVNAGSSFSNVVMNLKKFKKFWPEDFSVVVPLHAVNVLRLDALLNWLYAEDIIPIFEFLNTPEHFQVQAIPKHLRQESVSKIGKVMLDRKSNIHLYHKMMTTLLTLPYEKHLHEKFILNVREGHTLSLYEIYMSKNYSFHISKPKKSRFSSSRLSVYLAWGNLSIRQVLHYLNNRNTLIKNIPCNFFLKIYSKTMKLFHHHLHH